MRFRIFVDLTHAHYLRDTRSILNLDQERRIYLYHPVLVGRIGFPHGLIVPTLDGAVHADANQLRGVFGVQEHDDRG